MATLKDKMKISAENNLKEYEKLLQALKCSNVSNNKKTKTDTKQS